MRYCRVHRKLEVIRYLRREFPHLDAANRNLVISRCSTPVKSMVDVIFGRPDTFDLTEAAIEAILLSGRSCFFHDLCGGIVRPADFWISTTWVGDLRGKRIGIVRKKKLIATVQREAKRKQKALVKHFGWIDGGYNTPDIVWHMSYRSALLCQACFKPVIKYGRQIGLREKFPYEWQLKRYEELELCALAYLAHKARKAALDMSPCP